MNYIVKVESFNGSVKTLHLPSKGAVASFLNIFPTTLPVGISMKVSCDMLGISGVIRGKAKL